jgi:hypothetical protein
MVGSGANIVAGVTPGKHGHDVDGIPVFSRNVQAVGLGVFVLAFASDPLVHVRGVGFAAAGHRHVQRCAAGGFTEHGRCGVRRQAITARGSSDPRLLASLETLVLAEAMRGPEWVRNLCWQVAAGFMTGDEAVAVIIDDYPRRPMCPQVLSDIDGHRRHRCQNRRVATWDDVARIVAALPETAEASPRRRKVRNKLIAWERALRARPITRRSGRPRRRGDILGVRVPDEGVTFALIADDPAVYFTPPHFDGYPAVLVKLDPSASWISRS